MCAVHFVCGFGIFVLAPGEKCLHTYWKTAYKMPLMSQSKRVKEVPYEDSLSQHATTTYYCFLGLFWSSHLLVLCDSGSCERFFSSFGKFAVLVRPP